MGGGGLVKGGGLVGSGNLITFAEMGAPLYLKIRVDGSLSTLESFTKV